MFVLRRPTEAGFADCRELDGRNVARAAYFLGELQSLFSNLG